MNWRKLLYLPMALALLLLLIGCGNSGTETAAPDSAPEALENTMQAPETVTVPEEEESGGTPTQPQTKRMWTASRKKYPCQRKRPVRWWSISPGLGNNTPLV